ncbi:hypothetical protein CEXT_39241 [Caerostris extrusa]|uniref:Uncharacterized protein n=1 Tax=Caerostris extrusa TaxID=172846 RepID=A0AAV4VGF4_CAEEX|nr:hypothetical protein CEXT_39241 [Caerostris extrusa]
MDRERTFEDLKKFVYMTAFFMGVKIIVDYVDVGIFDAGVMLVVGIVIHRVLNYGWNKRLVIWKRMMLFSKMLVNYEIYSRDI